MASESKANVYLGYEDCIVTKKDRSSVTFKTNKIGGKPVLSSKNVSLPSPVCKLCGLHQLLVIQVYVPLDDSLYHRNLYLFACINPKCWNQHESWTCLRVQSLKKKIINKTVPVTTSFTPPSATSWLASADDWNIDEDTSDDNTNSNNNINNNITNDNTINLCTESSYENESADDSTHMAFNDDPNTNSLTSIESPVCDYSVECIKPLEASAEIEDEDIKMEDEESENVFVDTPKQPQCNLINLMQQTSTNTFKHHEKKSHTDLTFNEIFMYVDEENLSNEIPQHVHDLVRDYQHADSEKKNESSSYASMGCKLVDARFENYEEGIPKHGDEMFHNFIERIQMNPGQLLRYCRDNSAPLLLSQLPMPIEPCQYCKHDRIFELQLLPTIIPKLKLNNDDTNFQLEFGTVLILTCSKSCWSLGDEYKEELVFLQAEK